uniref:GST C-terminal domain-containing protein n=1 Tax=Graphocephala atropunctata TaxID=36148 RepID=A0A1B6MTX5_9HEMI
MSGSMYSCTVARLDVGTTMDLSTAKSFMANMAEPISHGNRPDEVWSNEAIIYQPTNEEILVPDKASSLSLEAFLRMCNLNYRIIYKKNAEYMSPSGKLPLLKIDIFVLSELTTIINFAEQRGKSLSDQLQVWEKTELKAYLSLVTMILTNAENYVTWVDQENFNRLTKIRFSSIHPWPLNWILIKQKKQQVLNRLSALGWQDKTPEEVFEEVHSCCRAFSDRLDGDYFFGSKFTELDAVFFAHIYTIVTTYLPNNQLSCVIRSYPKIITYCQRIIDKFFPELNTSVIQDNNKYESST